MHARVCQNRGARMWGTCCLRMVEYRELRGNGICAISMTNLCHVFPRFSSNEGIARGRQEATN